VCGEEGGRGEGGGDRVYFLARDNRCINLVLFEELRKKV